MHRAKRPSTRLGPRVLPAVLILVLGLCAAANAQGFDAPSAFGSDEQPVEFAAAGGGSAEGRYFVHDQAIKIAVVGGLSVLAVLLLTKRGARHRKWLLLLSGGLVGFYLGGALCPLASVQNVILKWNTGYLLLFLIAVVLALLSGRVFCGTVCPFGAVQELLHVRRWSFTIPAGWRRWLGALKYAVLVYLVARVLVTGTSVLAGYTPFKSLFTWGGTPATVAFTVAVAALSVVLWRPFCRFLCPLGALLSLFSRFSLFRLEVESGCVSCGQCTAKCPVGACDGGRGRSAECFLCGECVKACPVSSLRLVPRWPIAVRRSRTASEVYPSGSRRSRSHASTSARTTSRSGSL